ncbi:MAG TPA: HAD family hydrolase [Kofleriaceae bacterium]|nr:HAD family hydrolase [Kofleriaceae bacterium]
MIAFVFDLDGTLLDLPVDIEPVRERAAAPLRARGFTGELRPILATIDRATAELATDEADRRALIGAARAEIDAAEIDAAHAATARPGAARILAAVRATGAGLGIVTNNGRACIAPALARAGLAEATRGAPIITRDDVAAPKPDPAGLIQMAGLLLPTGGDLVFIGDGESDIRAGAAAQPMLAGVQLLTIAIAGRPAWSAGRIAADLSELATEIEEGTWTTHG